MKRKVLLTMLCLAVSFPTIACETENTTEQQKVIATERTMETEEVEEPTEQETETEMFALDVIEDSSNGNEIISTGTRDDYPDSNPEHQKAWDDFCENWNEADYGTTTKGKCENNLPYYGDIIRRQRYGYQKEYRD